MSSNPTLTKIRVLLADDHALFRDGMRALLLTQPQIEFVGAAASGEEAVAMALREKWDVMLMDINMPDLSGIEATRRILAQQPEAKIIMVTMLEDDASVFAAMRAGARGYVLKGSDSAEMLQTIQAVANGQILFGPQMATRVLRLLKSTSPTSPTPPLSTFPSLTEREHELLTLIARGDSNATIAETLVISPKTVRNHINSIFSKLQVTDRAQAIVKARKAGYGHT